MTVPIDSRNHVRRATNSILRLVAVVAIGTVGFSLIEGWPAWKSAYFTLVTITTVGYGDEGISDRGAQFATLLLVFGIATVSHAFATLVQLMVSNDFAWRKRMLKSIDKLRGHTIVCGFGRMGRAICSELSEAGIPFCIVDPASDRVAEACEAGYLAIEGNGMEDEVLQSAGIENAAHVVAMGSPEENNIVISLTARELSPTVKIISRAASPRDRRKLERAGADKVISPMHSGGVHVATMIARPRVAELLSTMENDRADIALAEVQVVEGSSIIGSKLADYGRETARNVCFVALDRPGQDLQIPPKGSIVVEPEDVIIVAGDPEQIATMREHGLAKTMSPTTPEPALSS